MAIDWKLLADIAGGVGVIAAAILGWMKLRQVRKERALGLEPNPTRCDRHEERLAVLEANCAAFKEFKDMAGPWMVRLEAKVDKLLGDK